MGVSLETRVPFLDHRVIEFEASILFEYKINSASSRRLLREVFYRYVPRELIERLRMRFTLPLHNWLRSELKEWASKLLDGKRLDREGYINGSFVQQIRHEHLSGKRNWSDQLWNILMFQVWLGDQSSSGMDKALDSWKPSLVVD